MPLALSLDYCTPLSSAHLYVPTLVLLGVATKDDVKHNMIVYCLCVLQYLLIILLLIKVLPFYSFMLLLICSIIP